MSKIPFSPNSQATTKQTHTVFCVDVSGSMSGSLPKLRNQLKNKLAALMTANLFSLIYFSGRNDWGTIFQAFQTGSATLMQSVFQAIDNLLRPIGMTAFASPLSLAGTLVEKDCFNRLVFMTDGYNNDIPAKEVKEKLLNIAPKFDEIVFVAYGWYADNNFLNELASSVGGRVIQCEDFDNLDVVVTELLNTSTAGTKISIDVPNGINEVISLSAKGDVVVCKVTDNKVSVPADSVDVFEPISLVNCSTSKQVIATIIALIQNNRAMEASRVIAALGETELVEKWKVTFGKQAIQKFAELCKAKLNGEVFITFRKVEVKPTISVMELLQKLASGENMLYPSMLNYQRMSIGKKDKEAVIPIADLEGKTVKEMKAVLDGVKEPIFVEDNPNVGYLLNGLAFNSSRANVSIRVKIDGMVTNVPNNEFGIEAYRSFIYRTYNVMKDGILHTPKLFCALEPSLWAELNSYGIVYATEHTHIWEIDLSELPMVNPDSIKQLSSKEMVENCFMLERAKAFNKVFKFYSPDRSLLNDVPKEQAEFLKTVGITVNGFNPKKETVESTDFYMALEFDCKFAGLSALPSVTAVLEKQAANKKINLADSLMLEAITVYNSVKDAGLDSFQKNFTRNKNAKELKVASDVMSLILSRGWFADRTNFDDNDFNDKIKVSDSSSYAVSGTLELKEVEVKI